MEDVHMEEGELSTHDDDDDDDESTRSTEQQQHGSGVV
jgi:hypothetical protein